MECGIPGANVSPAPPRPPPPRRNGMDHESRSTSTSNPAKRNTNTEHASGGPMRSEACSRSRRVTQSRTDESDRIRWLEQSAAQQNLEHSQSAQAAFRRGKAARPTREVVIPRDAHTPLGLSLKVVPDKARTGSIVTVVRVESHGLAAHAARQDINNSIFPGDRILFINGKDLLAVHHTMCLKMLEVEHVVIRIAIPEGFTTVQAMVAARAASNGGLVRPWSGPLAQTQSREPNQAHGHSTLPQHPTVQSRQPQQPSLGRPGNPWVSAAPAASDAPPSYEAAIRDAVQSTDGRAGVCTPLARGKRL